MDLTELQRRAGIADDQLDESMFTRQHLKAIANLLATKIPDMALRKQLSDYFILLFRQSNPRFDIARWNAAVGL